MFLRMPCTSPDWMKRVAKTARSMQGDRGQRRHWAPISMQLAVQRAGLAFLRLPRLAGLADSTRAAARSCRSALVFLGFVLVFRPASAVGGDINQLTQGRGANKTKQLRQRSER